MRDEGRKVVAVLFGGRSVEHEISIITALQLIDAMDTSRFSPVPVYVSSDGAWYSGRSLLKPEFYRGLPGALADVERVALLPIPNLGGLVRLDAKPGWLRKAYQAILPVDVYIPAFHGTYGEDGCIQGFLELAAVAYTGSGVLPSAVGMDKFISKRLASTDGIPVLPSQLAFRAEIKVSAGLAAIRERVAQELDFPMFVKPRNLGSSVGIGVARDQRELDAALLRVFEVDDCALMEPMITRPLEVNVAVLDGVPVRTSAVEVPVVEEGSILGYEEKYLRQGSSLKSTSISSGTAGTARAINPVDLPNQIRDRVTAYAVQLFRLFGCSGVARVDFICDPKDDAVYFNEINTLPGSLAYYLWSESTPPLLYTELLTTLIEQALERRRLSNELSRESGFRSLSRMQ